MEHLPYTDLELISEGAELIRAERLRQCKNGNTFDQDDLWTHSELAWSAIAYAIPSVAADWIDAGIDPYDVYPWGDIPESLDLGNPIRKLVIAGALIAAEIERLQRAYQRINTITKEGR